MKKALVLTLIMVLAMAGIASAEVKFGGELKADFTIETDKPDAGTAAVDVPLTLTAKAEEEGVWSVSADLKANAVSDQKLGLGDWDMQFIDDLFTVDVWKGRDKGELSTPFGFVKAPKAQEKDAKFRVTTDACGYVDLKLDYDPDNLALFASKALDDLTVGAAVKKNLTAEGLEAAGHVKYGMGDVTLTGEVGMNTAFKEENFMAGGKVEYDLTDKIALDGKVVYKAENVGPELTVEAGAGYTEDLFKVTGRLTREDDLDKATNPKYVAKVNGSYRSNTDVGYDDLFGDYHTLTGYAAFAEGVFTPAVKQGDDNEPTIGATVKGATVAMPDLIWVLGEFNYETDKDGIDGADSTMALTAEGTVKLTEKLKVVPKATFKSWPEVKTELVPSVTVTYSLSGSAEIGASYENKMQKLADADRTTDGVAKVYFKTSF